MKAIKVLAIFLITILFLACAADSGSGGSSHNLDNLQIVTLASKDATSTPIIAAKDKDNSDMLVVLGDTNASGDVTNVNGVMFSDANGNSMRISIDNTGLPTKVELRNGFYYTLNNYQGNTALMSVYDASDNALFSDRITFANGEIAQLQSFFTPSGQNTQNLNSPQNFQLPSIKRFSDPAFLLSLGSTVTNILACSVSIKIALASAAVTAGSASPLSIAVAILGCGSYLASLLSTLDPDSVTLNVISTTLDGIGCATVLLTKNIQDLISCVALALDLGAFLVRKFNNNPDLQVFAIRQLDGRARVFSGDEITLLTSTRNIDSGASEPTTLGLYLSEDGNINGDDIYLEDIATIRALAGQGFDNNEIAGQNQRHSFSAPSTPGVYYYGVCVIPVPGEKETENNCSDRIRIEVNNDPDLVVSAFTSGNDFVTDYAFSLSTVIGNIGTSSSAASNVRFYGSHDRNISPRDTQIGEAQPLDSLAGGGVLENNAQLVITPNTPGTYYYGACVDRVASEYSTSNNCSLGVAVRVRASSGGGNNNPPDLIISSFTASPTTISANQDITLRAVVENSGGQRSSRTNLRYYLSSNSKISPSDSEITNLITHIPNLDPNERSNESAQTQGHSSGTAYYGVCVDSISGEPNTSNNCSRGVAITVTNSVAGASWTQTQTTTTWSARNLHTSVVFDNKLWILGGYDDNDKNDVWFSTDGVTWTQATSDAAWSVRDYHSSVVFDDKLWVLGGNDGSRNYKNDVWFSEDGVTWTQATSSATWSVRDNHSSVVYDDKLWVLGGHGNGGIKNDVWFSEDGATWTQATSSAAWSVRSGHSSVVFDDKLWVLGGGDRNNDVWFSEDGATWTQATSSAAWSARAYHSSVVFDDKLWVLGGGDRNNDVWFSEDGATWTQATSSAAWSARAYHSSVVFDNKIWILGGNDGSSKNDAWYSEDGASWTTTITWSARSNHSSVVFDDKLWVLGGNDKNDVWYSEDGSTWTQATSSAAWSARNEHTSVVFDDKLWVLGGGFYLREKNDVWFSADGVTWTQATSNADWSVRRWHSSVVFDDKLWVLGGDDGGSRKNDVWFSADGSTWTQATSSAAWSVRGAHTSVVFDNKLWVLGGYDGGSYKNDVWFSEDGITWTRATSNAGWSARDVHTSVVFDDKLWVLGGKDTGGRKNDVWFSEDGITWTQATSSAAWSARWGHSSVVFDNKIWILGGNDGSNKNDAWYLD